MASTEAFREFISDRLSAAAEEIFTVFERTILQYEEQIDRQRRLLDITEKKLHTAEDPEQHVCDEEQLCNQEITSSLDQENTEPPQYKEEPQELCISQREQQLERKQEPGTFEENPADGGNELSEGEIDNEELLPHNPGTEFTSHQPTAAEEETLPVLNPIIIKEEDDSQSRLLDIICKPQIKLHRIDCSQQHMVKKRTSELCQEEPAPPKIEETQKEVCTTVEEDQLLLMESGASVETPAGDGSDRRELEPKSVKHLLTKSVVDEGQFQMQNLNTSTNQCEIETGNKSVECHICGESFKSISPPKKNSRQNDLKKHKRLHTGEKPYRCSHCGLSFSWQKNLKDHERMHMCGNPFSCPECGENFVYNSRLVSHMRVHKDEKPFSCSGCNEKFRQQTRSKEDNRIYSGLRSYPCSLCSKRFTQKAGVLRHMKTHTGEKPYACSDCNKSFSRPYHLKCHKRLHTGEKPFTCSQCGLCFRWGNLLKAHERIHSGERFSCSVW